MNGNELLLSAIDIILNIIESRRKSISINIQKLKDEFNFSSFDDDFSFYSKILTQLNLRGKAKMYENIFYFSNCFLRNLVIFLEYLSTLIKSNQFEKLYQDPIIKLDISIIIGCLTDKYGSEIVESPEFFPLCIKELEKKYKIKNKTIKTKYDEEIKIEAEKKLKKFEVHKKRSFTSLLQFLLHYYYTFNDSFKEDYEIIDKLFDKYHDDFKNMSINELENNYLNNDAYKKYIDFYIEQLLSFNGYDKERCRNALYELKKKQLTNYLFTRIYSKLI